jgi:hypothetical protein
MTRPSPKQPCTCTWCARPVDSPIWLLWKGSRLPYHSACMGQLQQHLTPKQPA